MPTILGANTLSTGYDVENSLKFNDGDTPNLVRTISSGADVTKFTFSFWCVLVNGPEFKFVHCSFFHFLVSSNSKKI